jgi:hypothetical protein
VTYLLQPRRYHLAATSAGDLAFFGGGYNDSLAFHLVEIFDSGTYTWNYKTLS